MKIIHVTNIDWDTTVSDELELIQPLPTEMDFTFDVDDPTDAEGLSYEISDALSDATGFCVLGFDYTIIEKD